MRRAGCGTCWELSNALLVEMVLVLIFTLVYTCWISSRGILVTFWWLCLSSVLLLLGLRHLTSNTNVCLFSLQ